MLISAIHQHSFLFYVKILPNFHSMPPEFEMAREGVPWSHSQKKHYEPWVVPASCGLCDSSGVTQVHSAH